MLGWLMWIATPTACYDEGVKWIATLTACNDEAEARLVKVDCFWLKVLQ